MELLELFVNRETELQLIDESFNALLDKKLLLRTPIIELQGIGGIGKTSLLRQVEQRCRKTQLPYLWVDVSQNPANVSNEIITQFKKYIQDVESWPDLSLVHATKYLLNRGPVVMLFDAVDSAYEKQLGIIESFLQDLVDHERIFVVLTSKKVIPFQEKRSIARKLTTLSLKPLNREHCDFYMDKWGDQVDLDTRDLIFAWTRGYPLALHVLVQAVHQGLDPRTEQGQKKALALLTEQVINQEVLASIEQNEQQRYRSLLQLLAVPRRFNLVIMQELIEKFDPTQKKESSMAYFGLPREINEATDILNWNMLRAGFSMDEPIRSIFLLLLKSELPERYFAIHEFLARTNLDLAKNLQGSDRIRYVCESLYHIASNTSLPSLEERLIQTVDIIFKDTPTILKQFAQEFAQDDELRDALGENLASIQIMIDTHLAGM